MVGRSSKREDRQKASLVDVTFGVILLVTAAVQFDLTRGFFFRQDDWSLSLRGRAPGDLLEPYNRHLSIVIIALYRVLFGVFGFRTYVPWRLVGVACLIGVPLALFLVFRARVGPCVAGVAASSILWFHGLRLAPPSLNHYLALIGGIVCAGALDRNDRAAHARVAIALAFSLASAGGGVAVVAACVVHSLCRRAPLSRWIAVLIPALAWGLWWNAYARDLPRNALTRYDFRQVVDATFNGVVASFDGLALDWRPIGIVFMIAFVVHLAWRLTQGLSMAANVLAWTAALVVWWFGLAYTRGTGANPHLFRYQMFGAVLVLLALLPPKPLLLAPEWSSLRGALVLMVVAGLIALVNFGAVKDGADQLRASARSTRANLIVANLGPFIVPDWVRFDGTVGDMTARDYRRAVRYYGVPDGTQPASVDRAIIRVRRIHLGIRPADGVCAPVASTEVEVPPETIVVVETTGAPVDVGLRRFSATSTMIGSVPAKATGTLLLHAMFSPAPWFVSAPGACVIG
jgi:hypothetical protein